jgi:hypothetical protein
VKEAEKEVTCAVEAKKSMTASPLGMDIDEVGPAPVEVLLTADGDAPMTEVSGNANSTDVVEETESVDLNDDIIDPSPEDVQASEVNDRSPSPGIYNFVQSPPAFNHGIQTTEDAELRVDDVEDVSMSDLGGLFE